MSKHGRGNNDGELSWNDLVCLFGWMPSVWRGYVDEGFHHGQTWTIVGDYWGEVAARRVDGSEPSPNPNRNMDKLPPVRINHKNAHIPDPTEKNIEALAVKAWIDYKGGMERHIGHSMPEWDDLEPRFKRVWLDVGKGQIVVMTLLGGGSIEKIDAPQTK